MRTSAPLGSADRSHERPIPEYDPLESGQARETNHMFDLAGRHPSSFTDHWILGHRRCGRFSSRRGRSPMRAIL